MIETDASALPMPLADFDHVKRAMAASQREAEEKAAAIRKAVSMGLDMPGVKASEEECLEWVGQFQAANMEEVTGTWRYNRIYLNAGDSAEKSKCVHTVVARWLTEVKSDSIKEQLRGFQTRIFRAHRNDFV